MLASPNRVTSGVAPTAHRSVLGCERAQRAYSWVDAATDAWAEAVPVAVTVLDVAVYV